MKTIRILILEDDLETLATLLARLKKLENKLIGKNQDIAITTLSEYTQVEEYINQKRRKTKFDVILLDRDCKACGSFHVLDLNRVDKQNIIAISSIPEYNNQAQRKGISKVVHKDLNNLNKFGKEVIKEIEKLINLK